MDVSDQDRRRFLAVSTAVVGLAGAALSTGPFIASLAPSSRALSLGAPVQVDLRPLEPGQQITVPWRGKPVWILHRTRESLKYLLEENHLARLRDPYSEDRAQQPDYVDPRFRSIRDTHFIAIGICTHLGCVPTFRPETAPPDLGPEWIGGYFCPCHGSRFDLAGRVYRGVPAPRNLEIPPHRFITENLVEIGVDS